MIAGVAGVETGVLIAFLSTLLFNVGNRHVMFNFTERQKDLISHPITQNLIMFSMFYMGTRNVVLASIMWVVYWLVVRILLNENHDWNLFPRSWLKDKNEGFGAPDPTALYYENLKKLPVAVA